MILLLSPEGLRVVSDHLRLINQMRTIASLNPAPLLEEMSFDEDIREKDKDCTDEGDDSGQPRQLARTRKRREGRVDASAPSAVFTVCMYVCLYVCGTDSITRQCV